MSAIRKLSLPATITFDDGYADNFEFALPLLEKFDLSASVFVVSSAVASPFEMWWDELERKYLTTAAPDWRWGEPTNDSGVAKYVELFSRYRQDPFPIFEDQPLARPDRRMLTLPELQALARHPLISIGAHTQTHPVLSNIPVNLQVAEIAGSKAKLESFLACKIETFAYPNGFPSDYTNETVNAVRDAGFVKAYVGWDGLISEDIDPYQIPRVMVRDWDGDTFAAYLLQRLREARR